MTDSRSTENAAPGGTCAAAGSAHPYTLLKRCPDGRVISLHMVDEAALREHLEAMWRYTEGYSVVAVVSVPNIDI